MKLFFKSFIEIIIFGPQKKIKPFKRDINDEGILISIFDIIV